MIDMNKKYRTRDGRPVRVLCVDKKAKIFTVLSLREEFDGSEVLVTHTRTGSYNNSHETPLDLIEVSPYDDFRIDDPVMVRDNPFAPWERRHFAGITTAGEVNTFANGRTSWSDVGDMKSWHEARRPTPEELSRSA